MKLKYLLLLLLIQPAISACDQSDDVVAIFTQGNWKLTSIFFDDNKGTTVCKDYWNDEPSYKASTAALEKGGNFVLSFKGAEIEGETIGTYTGRATGNEISGNWTANGKNNKFSVSGQGAPAGSEDVLGKVFINALINAYKYEGDTNGNLRIFFLDPERKEKKRFLLLHISQ